MAKPTATTLTRNLRILPTAGVNTRAGQFGEIGYDRSTNTLIVYDGSTPGGFPLLRADLNNLEGSIIDVTGSVFGDDSVLLVDGVRSKIVGPVETTTVLASSGITGNLTGNVNGNVTGNVTGVVTAQAGSTMNGSLTGNVNGNITSTGTSSFTGIDVNGGTIDGATIGSSTPSSIVGTSITANTGFFGNVTGNLTGNADTVTNGVYSNLTYSNPSWITSLSPSKISFSTGPSITYQGTGPTNFTIKSTTVAFDFGNTAISSKTFTVSDAAALTTSKIVVTAHPTTENGAMGGDEFELDPIAVSGVCTANGTIQIYATSLQGPVKGTRNFQYVVI
jgi:hypothetical protein